MTPAELAAILDVLASKGVYSAEVPTSVGPLKVVLGPGAMPPLPEGDEPTPGGWKGPDRLDSDPLDIERSVP